MNKETPIFVFLFGVFLILVSPALLTQGMFMDGMIYAAVAKNMADGIGSFWHPFFTASCYPDFYEHPPLAMGILSILYRVFGDSFLIEKIYSFSAWLFVAFGIVKIWRYLGLNNAWIPVLILMLVTRIVWAATNNGLENTLAVFLVFAIWFYLKSLSGHWIYLVFSGLCIAAGFLTKGPFGLFLWGFPMFYSFFVLEKKAHLSILDSLKLLVLTLIPLLLVYASSDAAYDNLINYLDIQLVKSLKHVETVESRWFIVRYFFAEMILPMLFVVGIMFGTYKMGGGFRLDKANRKLFYAFFLTGLCGVLPIMISMKQSGFYILPTFSIFAMSLAFLVEQPIGILMGDFIQKAAFRKTIRVFALTSLFAGMTLNVYRFGQIGRDEDKITAMHEIASLVEGQKTIGVSYELWNDWALQAYFQRFYGIALDASLSTPHDYFLLEQGESFDKFQFELLRVPMKARRYELYTNTFVKRTPNE